MRLKFVRSREQGGLVVDRWACQYAFGGGKRSCFYGRGTKFDELQPRESSCEGASTLVMRAAPLASTSDSSYLVDPASSHMLVSKIKPCMSKYKQICTVKLRMAH
jgi:hypothetical protein